MNVWTEKLEGVLPSVFITRIQEVDYVACKIRKGATIRFYEPKDRKSPRALLGVLEAAIDVYQLSLKNARAHRSNNTRLFVSASTRLNNLATSWEPLPTGK